MTTYYWHPSRGNAFCNDIKQGVLKAPDRETSIAQYQYAIDAAAKKGLNRYWNFNFSADEELQYAIERDTFRYFPIRGFGPGAWSQEKRWRIQNPPKLQPYLKGNSQDRRKHECTVEHYVLLTLMFPQGLVFKEFEKLFDKKWSFDLMSERLKKVFDEWVGLDFIEIDSNGFRFKDETISRSTIHLAEFHTECFYWPAEELSSKQSAQDNPAGITCL